jgi:hypothetical protein
MFREPSSTDEVTCLMPAKGFGTLPPPPRSVRPNAQAPVQSFRPPQHQGFVHQQQLDGEQTRTDYRTLPPAAAPGSFPARVPFGMSAMPQPIPQSMIPTIPPAPNSFAPVAYSMSAAGKSDSDPRIDPPATVITTRTKVLTGRPTLSWGAALVAMGIFGGLVTAVLARGDGDALVDATASFVDPAHAAHANAAQAPAVETKLATPMLQNAPVAAPVAAAPAAPELGVIAPTMPADPVAAKPASMAYSHPAQAAQAPEKKAEPKAEAPKAAAPAPAAKVASIKPWTPPARPAAAPPAEKAEKAEKPATAKAEKKGNATKDDMASAKEAKALADAQLEASLR